MKTLLNIADSLDICHSRRKLLLLQSAHDGEVNTLDILQASLDRQGVNSTTITDTFPVFCKRSWPVNYLKQHGAKVELTISEDTTYLVKGVIH